MKIFHGIRHSPYASCRSMEHSFPPSVSAKTSRTEVTTTHPHPSTTCFVWTKIQRFLMNIDHKLGPISWRGIFFSCLITIILFETRFVGIVLLDENKTDWILKYLFIFISQNETHIPFHNVTKWVCFGTFQGNTISKNTP